MASFVATSLASDIGISGGLLTAIALASLIALAMFQRRLLKWVILALIVFYVAACAVLHVKAPGIDPIHVPMSFYVLTKTGWFMTLTFFAMSAAILGTALLMATSPCKSFLWKLCIAGLAFSSGGVYFAGICPTDVALPSAACRNWRWSDFLRTATLYSAKSILLTRAVNHAISTHGRSAKLKKLLRTMKPH